MESKKFSTKPHKPLTQEITSKCNICSKEITDEIKIPNENICKNCKDSSKNKKMIHEVTPANSNNIMKEINDNKSLKKDCLIDNKPAPGISKRESNEKSAKKNTQDFLNNNEVKKSENKKNNINKTDNNKNHNKNNKIDNNIPPNKKCFYFILAFIVLSISIIIFKNGDNNIIYEKINEDSEDEMVGQNEDEQKDYIGFNTPIIGIDFGSSYSGFSLGIDIDTIETKYENIEPTIIVMEKKSRKGYKYGNDADVFMKNGRDKNYIYFDRIKTKLDPKFAKKHESEIYIEANYPKNYKMELKLVISEYLRLFSDNILKYVNLKGKNYSKDDIKWVITVPAIWNEYGKQLMIFCSKEAGMNNISIALEPEAASLTMFNDKIIDKDLKNKGKIFMLIDAGGYTIDITINEIIDQYGNLKQLSPPSGGAYGSMNINKELIKLVEEVFGEETINDLKENKFDLWKITLDSIESKKRQVKNDGSDSDEFKIDTRFEKRVCDYSNLCSKYTSYGNIKYDNNLIYIPKEIMKNIIHKNISPIIAHIKRLILKFKEIKIDLIVLTGGFSNCNILIDEIKNNFKSIPYNILTRPETSVMNGAVLYGIEPNRIVSRKAPFTIGLSTYSKQKENTRCENKVVTEEGEFCEYFDMYKRKGDDIKNGDLIIRSYTPLFNEQTAVSFKLYYSTLNDPIYIQEEGIKRIATFNLDMKELNLPMNERIAEVKMEFSSCITIKAKNIISGEEIKIMANYYNRKD